MRFLHRFISLKESGRLFSPLPFLFIPHTVSLFHIWDLPSLHFIFNQSRYETLSPLLFRLRTSSGGKFPIPGLTLHLTPSLLLGIECALSIIPDILFVACSGRRFSTASWKSHHYEGSRLFQSRKLDRTRETLTSNSTELFPQLQLINWFSLFQISVYGYIAVVKIFC